MNVDIEMARMSICSILTDKVKALRQLEEYDTPRKESQNMPTQVLMTKHLNMQSVRLVLTV
mgnify:CR=1 FL=1